VRARSSDDRRTLLTTVDFAEPSQKNGEHVYWPPGVATAFTYGRGIGRYRCAIERRHALGLFARLLAACCRGDCRLQPRLTCDILPPI
jgi:hypothetical protein